MRRNSVVASGVSVLATISIIACSVSGERKERLMLGTGGSGGEAYIWGGGAAKIVTQYAERVQLTSQLTSGSGENLSRLANGTLHIGVASNELNWEMFNGFGGMPKYEHRALYGLYVGDWHWAARKDFPGDSIYDFRGRAVSFGPKGGGSYQMMKYALDALGLTFDDFDAKYLSVAESVDAMKDGVIEAYAVGIGTPSSAFLDLATMPGGLRLISLSPEDIKKCTEKYEFFSETVMPANTYQGVNVETRGVGRWHFLVTRPDLPEDVAYEIAKTLTEHHDELVAIMGAARQSTPENTIKETIIPLHPGAERYFREKGYLQ